MKQKNNLIVLVLIVILSLVLYNYFFVTAKSKAKEQSISYTDFLTKVEEGSISRVSINNNLVKAESTDKQIFIAAYPVNDPDFIRLLKEKDVNIVITVPNESSGFSSFLFIALGLFLIFILVRSLRKNKSDQGSGGSPGGMGAFGFGKSKAKMILPEEVSVRFSDVAGIDEAKEDIQEIVDFLKNPKKFEDLGAKIPRGCLLVGSPGTGKTLLAKAIAGEAGVSFFSISGSDFVEMFVGVGASRVRDLFNQAKKHNPCVIFIDEIDAVGRQRGVGIGGGNDEREQTLNQLLVELDGFNPNQGIIVVAATNRADVLDKALLRPGRFDRQVVVPLPDVVGREKIFQIYLNKIPLESGVNVNILARGTTGFTGADIANLVNEAALASARKNKLKVGMDEFEEARDKILMGAERKSSKMDEKERILTAYHEAGHALVAFKTEGSYPVHKVTIVPRGNALGVTSFLPERDEYSRSYKQLIAQLAVLFGGRTAEELKFGKENISTGASGDIQMATNLSRKMVTEWGFSDTVGRVRYTDNYGEYVGVNSGNKISSEATSRDIELEIKKLINEAETKAKDILEAETKAHEDLANALLKYEILSGEEAKRICDGEDIEEIRKEKKEKKDENHKNNDNDDELLMPSVN